MNIPWEALSRAFVHPLRISILEVLAMDGGRVLSPNEISAELRAPLPKVDYHVKELAKANLLALVKTEPRRGATEHYYAIAPAPSGAGQ